MVRTWSVLLLAVWLVSCGRPVPKEVPFNFDAAESPKPVDFNAEAQLLGQWNDPRADSLKDFWERGEGGTLDGVDGVPLTYRVHVANNAKAAVVILPGRTEAIIKYAEVARDLVSQGYTTYTLTLRGQGEAGRMLGDAQKGYVVWFDDYVSDTHRFLADVVRPREQRVFLLAHSLGGAVAALLVDQHPTDVEAMVLSSPMFEIDLGSFPPPVAASLAAGICDSSDGTGYTLGAGPYEEETDFEGNTVTTSEPRFRWKVQQLRENPLIQLGGVTWRWLCQSLVGSSRAQQRGAFSATPTVIFQAADDTVVRLDGHTAYCDAAKRCTLSRLEAAKHELLMERDDVRNLVMARTVRFFDSQVAR